MVTIIEKSFAPIIRELTSIVNDFPEYQVKVHTNFGQVTNYMTVFREKPKPIVTPKKQHIWSWPEITPFTLEREENLDEIDIHLDESSWTEETKLSARLRVLPTYNKTLVMALSKYLEENKFKVTIEINS